MVVVHVGLSVMPEVGEEQYVPPGPQAVPVKSVALQTKSWMVVVDPVKVSLLEAVAVHVTTAPGLAGELFENAVNRGRWSKTKGDAVFPLPCWYVLLHLGLNALPSQIQANQALNCASVDDGVYVDVALVPLGVEVETAHWLLAPPPQVGGALAFAVGVLLDLQIKR
jgi:hypothetical protein